MIDWNFFLETDEPDSVPVAIRPDTCEAYIPTQRSFCSYYEDGTRPSQGYPPLRQAPPVGRDLFKLVPSPSMRLQYLTPAGWSYTTIVRAAYSFFEDLPHYHQFLIGESPKSLLVDLENDNLIAEAYGEACYDRRGKLLMNTVHKISPQIIIERLWRKWIGTNS